MPCECEHIPCFCEGEAVGPDLLCQNCHEGHHVIRPGGMAGEPHAHVEGPLGVHIIVVEDGSDPPDPMVLTPRRKRTNPFGARRSGGSWLN